MGQGDVPTSRGGPFRRRREKRQLEELAEASARGVTPRASSAHVRVLDDQSDARCEDLKNANPNYPLRNLRKFVPVAFMCERCRLTSRSANERTFATTCSMDAGLGPTGRLKTDAGSAVLGAVTQGVHIPRASAPNLRMLTGPGDEIEPIGWNDTTPGQPLPTSWNRCISSP